MRRMLRVIALTTIVAAALLAAPASMAQIKVSLGLTSTAISTGHASHTSLPLALGYWKEEGLDVEVSGASSAPTAVQLLVAGNFDFITIGGEDMLGARAKGVPIKSVYMHARKSVVRFVTPKTSGIKSIKDLKGKTVGLTSLRPSEFAESAFKEVGLDFNKDVNLIAIGFGSQALLAMQRGDAAAYLSFDMAVAAIENLGMEFTMLEPSYYKNLFGLVVATREDMIVKRPEVVAKLLRGVAKSVHFGLANSEAAIKLHWKRYPESKPKGDDEAKIMRESRHIFLSRFNSYQLDDTDKYGESFARQWKLMADQMKEQGQLPADFDVEKAYTNEFVDAANKWGRNAVLAQAKTWKD